MTNPVPIELSSDALQRYQMVCELNSHLEAGKTLGEALRAVVELPHRDAKGQPVRVSQRTLRRWRAAYIREDLGGLEPRVRKTIADSAVLGAELLQFVRLEKDIDPQVSVPQLIERARLRGIVSEREPISRITLWRACRRLGLPLRRVQRALDKDMRRFAYPNRMLMALCDGKHFRAGAKRAKRVALHFLDDATRMGLEVIVGTSETTELFLHGLYRLIQRYGLPKALYLDRGPGFISDDTRAVLARLHIRLILGTAAYPQAHGKVERFHRTAWEHLLRLLDGKAEVDPEPGALTLRLGHWMHDIYNLTPHESLEGKSPAQRWALDSRDLEFPSDSAWLKSCFLSTCERRVNDDNVIRYGPRLYEVPDGYARHRVRVTRHILEGDALSILHEGRALYLQPVQLSQNAYSQRARRQAATTPSQPPTARSAAELSFQNAFGPIVEHDGGFDKRKELDHEEVDQS